MGQPSEGLPLQNKKMATPVRNNTMSEECGTSCLGDKSQIYLLPFHIKIVLVKIYMKKRIKKMKGLPI